MKKINRIPQWMPTKEQREFLEEKAKTHGTITGYIRSLIGKEMDKGKR